MWQPSTVLSVEGTVEESEKRWLEDTISAFKYGLSSLQHWARKLSVNFLMLLQMGLFSAAFLVDAVTFPSFVLVV